MRLTVESVCQGRGRGAASGGGTIGLFSLHVQKKMHVGMKWLTCWHGDFYVDMNFFACQHAIFSQHACIVGLFWHLSRRRRRPRRKLLRRPASECSRSAFAPFLALVCVCLWVHVCMCVCVLYVHVCMYVCIPVCKCLHTHLHTHTLHTHLHTHTHGRVQAEQQMEPTNSRRSPRRRRYTGVFISRSLLSISQGSFDHIVGLFPPRE
jgi:hypothetical protein